MSSSLGNLNKSSGLVTFSGPFCVGKSTLSKILKEKYNFSHLINTTTRGIREKDGEKEGVDYYFVDEKRFTELFYCDDFINSIEFNGELYGTPILRNIDKMYCTDILSYSVKFFRREYKQKYLSIYLTPPNDQELIRRARERGDSEESITKRLELAKFENPRDCDIVIPTLELEEVQEEILRIIKKNF